jgi:hypothetical protein
LSQFITDLSHGIMLTRSNTNPVPSKLRAQTGWENGWKERAQQSKGVLDPGWGASALLKGDKLDAFSVAATELLTP